MKVSLKIASIVLLCGVNSLSNGAEKLASRPKILILSGSNNHDWQATTPFIQQIYARDGQFTVDVTNRPDTIHPRMLAAYQAVVSNWNDFPKQSELWNPAAKQLKNGLLADIPYQVLLGVTGSGKTFTIANLINEIKRPALVLSHNKTLAAQLYEEFKGFFPQNAVEYFVSYYDYYQPEAYLPTTDTYIEKDLQINDS
ncbi:hypothetical protein FACS1894121_1460 [Bacteroidia bacterium]|nr:hypothetical protein FACS1894121_1460 [Bacteroidia bacterium]